MQQDPTSYLYEDIPKEPQHKKSKTSIIALCVLLFGILLLTLAYFQKQHIYDWYMLRDYKPNSAISKIADDITLTDSARRMFYVNKPEILDKDTFNQKCSNTHEHTIVLGCYHSNQRGIYIYKVTDERLQGIKQVTAAHEVLHAAYDRLSSKERKRIDKLLQNYYDTQLTDERIKETINGYRETEPNDLVNEMHSIFATEIEDLPQELEDYYKKYFVDRMKVAEYANEYQHEFTSRKEQVDNYDKQLEEMRSQIDSQQQTLANQNAQLSQQRSELDSLRSSGDTASYNQRVSTFNAAVAAYNESVNQLKNLVEQHNTLVEKRNDIALQQQELSKAINSHLENL